MEKTGMQSVEEKNISMVALADIQPSGYNPRKHFDETSLAELADSIRQQGVLQPIGVRPIEENRYEVIFGERRYRASLMAGLETIPTIIYEVTDEVAEEMAVTENLQRKDVTPIEEANAFQKLIKSGRYDVHSLAVQFGKSEDYIRTRLKFTTLIPEIAALLEADEITISVASEICRYGEDIQREVYDRHLKENGYYSWRGMKASDVAKRIEQDFTTDLNRYSFDKTLCKSCPHNTNNMMLFCEGGCGKCANRKCLEDMNASYLVEKAMQMLEEHPTASLGRSPYDCNDTAVNRLAELGYEVETLPYCLIEYPEQPEVPEAEDYDTMEEYGEAQRDYEQEQADYKAECEDIVRRSEEGEISLYVNVGRNGIGLCYVETSAMNTAGGSTSTDSKEQLTPLEKLEKQDKRNKEIALEKTVEDTKKRIMEVDTTETKFGADEDKMIYFFLLASLRKENYAAVGIENGNAYYLSDKDKMDIIENLNGKAKAVIRRDFLIANFKNAYGNNAVASLLLDFAEKHMPEELAEIRKGYDEVYEKRHQRIEEKKAILAVQEKAKQEEPQPDEKTQTEDAAA